MVDSLGDTGHSRFLTPQMVREEDNFNKGQFEGIGAEVEAKDGNLTIVAPIDGSPAQQAGLKPGDIITRVNGQDISGLPLGQAVELILGQAGTKVTLTIYDPSTNRTRDVTLVRAKIDIRSVTWQRLPGTSIAHLRIAAFNAGVTKDLEKALTEMKQNGITGVILDLRSNPGGLLDEAVGTASQFLSTGNALEEKDAQGKITTVPVKPGGLATTLPTVVLIDQGTASAAEIVAAALQDAGRAKLIGETTFGTGTVLNQFGLPDGSALLIATQEWLTRNGRELWRHGVTPDTKVTLPADARPLIPETEQDLTAAGLQASKDTQLLTAVDSLTGTVSVQRDAHYSVKSLNVE
jgi:carboxyl-terminal processing protease